MGDIAFSGKVVFFLRECCNVCSDNQEYDLGCNCDGWAMGQLELTAGVGYGWSKCSGDSNHLRNISTAAGGSFDRWLSTPRPRFDAPPWSSSSELFSS